MHLVRSLLQHFTVPGRDYVRFVHATTGYHDFDRFYLLEWILSLVLLAAFCLVPAQPKLPKLLVLLRRFAHRRGLAVLFICLFSLLGRLALLTIEPFPAPSVHDEFSYLLAADTFAHGQVASPAPLDAEHFEGFHILLSPTYASMYPPASGLFYAVGQVLFGTPRAGLLLAMALGCGSLCWMLQAFVPPEWAFLGGMAAAVRLSWFSYFGNTYWGGASALLGGCLLLGAAGHLWRSRARARPWLLVALGIALLILFNNRPFEGGLLSLPILIGLLWKRETRGAIWSPLALPAFALLTVGLAASLSYAFHVTQSTQLPWSLQRRQWAITPPFIFQPADYHHSYAFPDQKDLYEKFELNDYLNQHHLRSYVLTVCYKFFRQWVFFIGPSATACFLFGLLPTFRSRKTRPLILLLALLGLIFFVQTWVQPQYIAVATGIFYVIGINGLRQSLALRGRSRFGGAIFAATAVGLLTMTLVRLVVVPLVPWPQTWASRSAEMLTRQKLNSWLQLRPGRQLVLVHYAPDHRWFDSWINNGADIAAQKVLWARDIPNHNQQLLCDYPNREIWLITPPEREEYNVDTTDPASAAYVTGLLTPYAGSMEACSQKR